VSWQALLIVAGTLLAAPPSAERGADREKIQGTWRLVSSETEGEAVPAESLKTRPVLMVFEGDRVAARMGDMSASLGTFTLDESHDPRWYDRNYPDGSPRRGIYRLEADRLTICIAALGKDRPSSFMTKPGDGQSLLVYQREKP
jgi:uncharacterized protein (TIGR03067 family)